MCLLFACNKCQWTPRALSAARNCDGRPVLEPPIFDYSQWIGEEYEQKRKALMKYVGDDVAKTTRFMDLDTETGLLIEYRNWTENSFKSASDAENMRFFRGLWKEMRSDENDVLIQWCDQPVVYFKKNEDGTYTAGTFKELYPHIYGTNNENTNKPPSQPCDHDTQSSTSSTSNHGPSQNLAPSIHEEAADAEDEDDSRSWFTASSSTSSSPSMAATRPLSLRLTSLLTNPTLLRSQEEEEDWGTSSDGDYGVD